jgi:hypothetical protein
MDFCGDFQKLCEKALTDHWTSSWNHLETDRLTKRMVQMVKQGLHKYGFQKGHARD